MWIRFINSDDKSSSYVAVINVTVTDSFHGTYSEQDTNTDNYDSDECQQSDSATLLCRINRQRVSHGLHPLTMSRMQRCSIMRRRDPKRTDQSSRRLISTNELLLAVSGSVLISKINRYSSWLGRNPTYFGSRCCEMETQWSKVWNVMETRWIILDLRCYSQFQNHPSGPVTEDQRERTLKLSKHVFVVVPLAFTTIASDKRSLHI